MTRMRESASRLRFSVGSFILIVESGWYSGGEQPQRYQGIFQLVRHLEVSATKAPGSHWTVSRDRQKARSVKVLVSL